MIDRRDAMLRLGTYGLGGLSLPALLKGERTAARPGKAKACILVFLWGGPPQLDMWDLKPAAPSGIRSLFAPIRTRVPGIDVCEHMPHFAKHTDKVAVVRSVTHPSNEHEPGVYHMLTGHQRPALRVPTNHRTRADFPNVASVVARFRPGKGLPAAVTIPTPVGHDGTTYAGTHAGFLGPRYDPFEIKAAHGVRTVPFAIDAPAGVPAARQRARLSLLQRIEASERAWQGGAARSLSGFHQQAMDMVTSPAAKRAFDLDREPPGVRERYGRNPYGESFLLARRLVEAGVRLVTFTWLHLTPSGRISNVWDTHGNIDFLGRLTGFEMLKANYCLPPLDRGLSALLEDLSLRGMLDETLVVAMGEMGRTPKVNKDGGRDHWGAAQSVLLAGGGVRGGQVYGSTDAHAAFVKERPVRPEDLLATIHHALGIDPESEIHDRDGRPVRACEGRAVTELF